MTNRGGNPVHEEELKGLVTEEPTSTVTKNGARPFTETNGFKLAIAIAYVMLWSTSSIVVRNSRAKNAAKGEEYSYNFVFVVLLVEITKCVSAYFVCVSQNVDIKANLRIGLWYGIPAVIYAFYNYLMFVNLAAFDVGSYKLVMNIRIAFTGILFQKAFNKPLGPIRWFALIVLATGVVIMQVGKVEDMSKLLSLSLMSVTLQAFLSAMGGVANEYLLKRTELPFALQNFFMYAWSIAINIVMMYIRQPGISLADMGKVFVEPSVVAVILVSAVAGLSTSVLLKYLNVVIKSFCTACEMLLASLMGWYVFGEPVSLSSFVAMIFVSFAIWLYNMATTMQEKYLMGWDPETMTLWQAIGIGLNNKYGTGQVRV